MCKNSLGERIKQRRKALQLSATDLALAIGKNRATIYRYENDDIEGVPANVIEAIADALSTTPEYLLGWEDDPENYDSEDYASIIASIPSYFGENLDGDDRVRAWLAFETERLKDYNSEKILNATNPYTRPVLGTVQAGIPITATENIIDYEELDPKQYSNPGEYFGLRIQGDSMEPRICEGDVVIVHQQSQIDSGDIAIVLINGDVATCKKVMHKENGIILSSFNPKYEPMYYSAEEVINLPVTIIGKVVELRGKF